MKAGVKPRKKKIRNRGKFKKKPIGKQEKKQPTGKQKTSANYIRAVPNCKIKFAS